MTVKQRGDTEKLIGVYPGINMETNWSRFGITSETPRRQHGNNTEITFTRRKNGVVEPPTTPNTRTNQLNRYKLKG